LLEDRSNQNQLIGRGLSNAAIQLLPPAKKNTKPMNSRVEELVMHFRIVRTARRVALLKTAACAVALLTAVAGSKTLAAEPDVATLTKALSSSDPGTRAAAIDALAGRGAAAAPAVPALAELLKDANPEIRWRVARTLGGLGPAAKSAADALVPLAKDPDAKARAYSAYALGQLGDSRPQVVEPLLVLAGDKDLLVRRAAQRAIRALQLPRETLIPLMVKHLKEASPADVMGTLNTLAESGVMAVPLLIDCLKDKEAAYWACLALAEIGPAAKDAVPSLAALMTSPTPEIRMQALMALSEIGPDAQSALPAISKALESDTFGGVRYAAAFAIGKIGVRDTNSVATLKVAMNGKDKFLRMVSAWALAKISPNDSDTAAQAVELLVEGMQSDDAHSRRMAARALGELKASPEIVIPALVKALKDSDQTVVGNAIDALTSLGPQVAPRAAAALQNKDLRTYAVRVLARLGGDAKEAVPALIAVLQDPDPEFVREAQFALGNIGPAAASAVPALLRSLSSDNERVRNSAFYAIGHIGPAAKEAVPTLRKMLVTSKDQFVHVACLWTLVHIQPNDPQLVAEAVPALTKALAMPDHELARIEVAVTLGNLGAAAKSALPALQKSLQDESQTVRTVAAKAIEQIEAASK
jgi:HEAT repeat protein